jgi:NADPH:quinone reductase-like Zn-dependent oxidoreductase
MAAERAEDLRFLTGLIEAGAVTPVVGKCYALADAPAAIRDLRAGHLRGKAVVTI